MESLLVGRRHRAKPAFPADTRRPINCRHRIDIHVPLRTYHIKAAGADAHGASTAAGRTDPRLAARADTHDRKDDPALARDLVPMTPATGIPRKWHDSCPKHDWNK